MTAPFVVLGCLASSALIVRVVRDQASRLSVLDRPNDRSSHSTPKPRLGGLGVMIPVVATGVALVTTGSAPRSLLVPILAVAGVALLGLVDDLRPLPATVRFGVQVILAVVVVGTAWERLPAASSLVGSWLPRPALAALAVLWIVWLTNLYNFMDGIDGLAGMQALLASAGLAYVAGTGGAESSRVLLLALAGSSLGFLLFNLPPSSIFMGDVGSTSIGFLFGVLPLLPGSPTVPVEPVLLALSFFVLDATVTLVRRILAGEKWYTPHRTHLYQRPVVIGVGHGPVLLVASGAMALAAGCAATWPRASTAGRAALLAVPVLLFVLARGHVARMERRVNNLLRSHN